MPPGIGYSRDIPLAGESGGAGPQGQGRVGGLSPQEAVRILSLRIPERPAQNAIAPLPLLLSPGGEAAGAQGLDALLQGLAAAFPQMPQPQQGGPNVSGVPQLPARPSAGGGLGRGPSPQLPTFKPSPTPAQPAQQRAPVNLPTPNIVFQPPSRGGVERPGQPINNPIPPPPPPPEWMGPQQPQPLPLPEIPGGGLGRGDSPAMPSFLSDKYDFLRERMDPLF